MATPLSATALLAALRTEDVTVVEHGGWRTHNRNHRGSWGPAHGVMIHHTVTRGTEATVRMCQRGYTGLPGPLCHGVIAKDGTVHLIGHGRANHAGGGDRAVLRGVIAEAASLPAPRERVADGNAHFYGFECVNMGDGRDPWPAAQLEAIERASAAICRAHGWNQRSVIGHREWTAAKIDPRGFGMDEMRSRIAGRLAAGSGSGRGAATYTVRPGDTLSRIAARHPGVTWQRIAEANDIDPPYLIHPGDRLTIPAGGAG